MGNLGLKGLVAEVESTTKIKTSYTGVALTYVMGQFDFGVSMQKVKPENANGRDEWSAGVGYTPFKNMQFYLDFAGLAKPNGRRRRGGTGLEVHLLSAFKDSKVLCPGASPGFFSWWPCRACGDSGFEFEP